MLIWKTQTLNVNMASVRYRCLLPLRYLSKQGIEQSIFGGADPVNVMPQTKAIVFVKSFRNQDVKTCERVHRLGVPIILDLCDNIFIENYAADNNYVPAKNFLLMAQQAAAIVTTGETLKGEVEKALGGTSFWELRTSQHRRSHCGDSRRQRNALRHDDRLRNTRRQRVKKFGSTSHQEPINEAVEASVWSAQKKEDKDRHKI